MKLIKISTDHYVVVDNSEIKKGDCYYWEVTKTIQIAKLDSLNRLPKNSDGSKKITHSTQPLEDGTTIHGIEHKRWIHVKYIDLSEVKELIGEVDVEKKAMIEYEESRGNGSEYAGGAYSGYINGYNQALEDNKEKKYTEEQMKDLYLGTLQNIGTSIKQTDMPTWEQVLQSLQPKTEWEVEFIDSKLKLL